MITPTKNSTHPPTSTSKNKLLEKDEKVKFREQHNKVPNLFLKTKEADHTRKIMIWAMFSAKTTVVTWVSFVAFIYWCSGPMNDTNPIYQTIDPSSKLISNIAAAFQILAITLRMIHNCNMKQKHWVDQFGNGGYYTVIVIMLISASTNILLANFPTPVLTDQITGMVVYPIRWAEWTVLVGTLTFMTESLDAYHWKTPAFMASTQVLSTICGLIFPLISHYKYVWGTVMFFSVCTWFCIYPRLYYTRKWMHINIDTKEKEETYTGAIIVTANKLRLVMLVIWSLIVLNFFWFWFANHYEINSVHYTSLGMFGLTSSQCCFGMECVLDCISKLLYTSFVIELYEACLDRSRLVAETFNNVSAELEIIWNHSSDVLIVVVETTDSGHLFDYATARGPLEWRSEKKRLNNKTMTRGNYDLVLRASPSLFQLTGKTHLGNQEKGVEYHDISMADDSKPSELELVLRKAWEARRDHHDGSSIEINNRYEFQLENVPGGPAIKECELVVNKVIRTGGSTTMFVVARDVSIQSRLFMLNAEQEKNLIARETAHTVKNLNTMAHHKLLDLLELLEDSKVLEKQGEKLPNIEAIAFADQLRQTLAIMMTAAQQTYQLSRVGEILRGDKQYLTTRVSECTRTWQKICGSNFMASPCAMQVLVDEFRIVAILSNGWSNALAHGDCTRMNETEIILQTDVSNKTLSISIVNASQHDELPFSKADETNMNDILDAQQVMDGFGASPAAKLTTQMGLAWMRKLCDGRLSLSSEGHGGKTTLTCVVDADFQDLLHCALAEYSRLRSPVLVSKIRSKNATSSATNSSKRLIETLAMNNSNASPSMHPVNGSTKNITATFDGETQKIIYSTNKVTGYYGEGMTTSSMKNMEKKDSAPYSDARIQENHSIVSQATATINSNLPLDLLTPSTNTSYDGRSNEAKLSMSCPSPSSLIRTNNPIFTSSPDQNSQTPYASAHLQSSTPTDIRVWDAALSAGLLRKYGITIVDDSRAFSIQMNRGFQKTFNIQNCKTLCGSKTTRYQNVLSLLRDEIKIEPALIILDRNLGHGINQDGNRVSMPTGDIVLTRLRQKGFDCCQILLTGDSAEQLEQYKNVYQGYYIDCVLDKHHLPAYVYIFEQYTQWICNKLPFGKLLLELELNEERSPLNMISGLRMMLVATQKELNLVKEQVQKYRSLTRLRHKDEAIVETSTSDSLLSDTSKLTKLVNSLVPPLVQTLVNAKNTFLALCKIDCIIDLIDEVLQDPTKALTDSLIAEEKSKSTISVMEIEQNTRKPVLLLSKLAREVILMQSIVKMAVEVLEEAEVKIRMPNSPNTKKSPNPLISINAIDRLGENSTGG